MSNKNRLVIYGEVLFDCFPDGSNVLGGAPFNVAWHCQAFGLNPLFISRVGNDRQGEQVKQEMQNWSMRTDGLQLDAAKSLDNATYNKILTEIGNLPLELPFFTIPFSASIG